MALPDFFVIGAPKAGTTAVHAALARHPQLYLSPVKEPKFFLGDGRPSARINGPGDAHSAREWVWERDRYEALFDAAPADALRGESTAFYLYDPAAHDRIAALAPEAKLIAVVRDPIDRAYSNWMHLWSDGLEPISEFEAACDAENDRITAGWGLFWHYRRLGLYGEQLEHLLARFAREQVLVVRYRELVDRPQASLDRICDFLAIDRQPSIEVRGENTRPFVSPGTKTNVLAPVVRAGASIGRHFPPQVWRRASEPLLWALQANGTARPPLATDARRSLVDYYTDDICRLSAITGDDYSDWLGDQGAGEYSVRRSWAPSERVTS
jgi:hypothetical protein